MFTICLNNDEYLMKAFVLRYIQHERFIYYTTITEMEIAI